MNAGIDGRRQAGLWLGLGAGLLALVLVVHGPTYADLSVQMASIAESRGVWAAVHWVAAAALLLLSGAGFMFFTEAVAGRDAGGPAAAWMLFALGSLVTIGTAVTEATAVSSAADSGDLKAFVVWWSFASGFGNGFLVVALATAGIAWNVSRSTNPPVPLWACRAAVLVALLSAVGWSLGQHVRVEIGGAIWFVSTLVMSLWLAWFGFRSYGATHMAGAADQ